MKSTFLERAKENLTAAELLFDAGLFNASANRANYSAFQISLVLLWNKGLEPKIDHKNALSLFINEFINKKKIFPSIYKNGLYSLQEIRNKADYQNGVNKKKAGEQLKFAKLFFSDLIKEFE